MDMCRYFLCFAAFSFIGWAYECAYYTIQQRRFVNSGFLSTCFCPIYGIGAMLGLILLGNIHNKAALFVLGMIMCSALEYFVSWLMERMFHQRWWDYTGWPLNINGRICIISAMLFGAAIVLLVNYVAPFTMRLINSMNDYAMCILALTIAFVMLADAVKSVCRLDTDKLWYVDKQQEFFENNPVITKIRNTFRK